MMICPICKKQGDVYYDATIDEVLAVPSVEIEVQFIGRAECCDVVVDMEMNGDGVAFFNQLDDHFDYSSDTPKEGHRLFVDAIVVDVWDSEFDGTRETSAEVAVEVYCSCQGSLGDLEFCSTLVCNPALETRTLHVGGYKTPPNLDHN